MSEPTLRELLNRLRWDGEARPAEVVLTVLSREAGRDAEKAVVLTAGARFLPAGVLLADGTFLPYHRVISVRVGAETAWRARRGSEHGQS